MDVKEKGMQKRLFIVIAAVAAVAIVAMVLLLALGGKEETYRSVRIVELEGGVTIEREGVGVLAASSNMNLVSGDAVKTEQNAYAVLQLDSDKFVMLAESGSMTVVAEGDEANSRTAIRLESGSVLNEIQNPLSSGSSYDIVTPNATMSVRGTVFEVRKNENDSAGDIEVLVYDGKVAVGLDGMEPALYVAGEYTQFTEGESPQFIVERAEIAEEHLNPQFMERLEQINSQSRELNLGTVQLASAQTQGDVSEPQQTPAVPEPTATPSQTAVPAPVQTATPKPATVPVMTPTPVGTPKPGVKTPAPVQSPAADTTDQNNNQDNDQNDDSQGNENQIETDNSENTQQPDVNPGNGGNAEDIEKPGDDGIPGGGENPGEDGLPGDSEKPGDDGIPGDSEKPGDDGIPGDSEKPGEDGNPGDSEKPGEDGNPGDSENPGEDGNPGDGENPGEDGTPGDGENPGEDGTPGDGENPGEDGNPGDDGNTGDNDNSGDNDNNPGDGSWEIYDKQNFWQKYTYVDYKQAVSNSVDGTECTVIYYTPHIVRSEETEGVRYSTLVATPPAYTSEQVTVGSKLAEPADPVEEGLTFAGWYLEDGTKWDFDEDVVKADTCLYPKWSDGTRVTYFPVICRSAKQYCYYCNCVEQGSLLRETSLSVGGNPAFLGWKRVLSGLEWYMDQDTVQKVESLEASWSN